MGQVKFVVSLLLAALFGIAIISFAINFGEDNDSRVKLGDDPDFVNILEESKVEITDFEDDSSTASDALTESTIEPGDETVATGGQFKAGFGTSMRMVSSVIRGGFKKIFGSDTGFGIFLTALTSVLVFIGALYIWKSWRGNPD